MLFTLSANSNGFYLDCENSIIFSNMPSTLSVNSARFCYVRSVFFAVIIVRCYLYYLEKKVADICTSVL